VAGPVATVCSGPREDLAFRGPVAVPDRHASLTVMPLTLTPRFESASIPVRAGTPLAVDLEGVVPDRVRSLACGEVARLTIHADGAPAPLGDLFDVAGDAADGCIECRGDFSRVHRIGAGMATGHIAVNGAAGRHAAAGMTGGTLAINGRAGDWLASEMSGGEVFVSGDAGDNAAGALPGSSVGMRGGLVVIGGSAGCLAGARMRRGILAIHADCGPAAAFEMRAGTVVVGGRVGDRPALGMRRGSLVALSAIPEPPPGFVRGAPWQPGFLPLLLRRLGRAGFQTTLEPGNSRRWRQWRWRQWHGDALAGGRGEVWTLAAAGGR
jgi:formylmethanofuran dehydrogenase subunit C